MRMDCTKRKTNFMLQYMRLYVSRSLEIPEKSSLSVPFSLM